MDMYNIYYIKYNNISKCAVYSYRSHDFFHGFKNLLNLNSVSISSTLSARVKFYKGIEIKSSKKLLSILHAPINIFRRVFYEIKHIISILHYFFNNNHRNTNTSINNIIILYYCNPTTK